MQKSLRFNGCSLARGFTLIELLVVIAIIAVLTTLLIGGSRVLREKARSVQCMSDLKQTGQALTLYAGDHNGSLPQAYIPQSPWTWPFILRAEGYFPLKWGSSPLDVPSCASNPNYRKTYTYGMNDFLSFGVKFKMSQAKTPTKTMLIADSLCSSGSASNAYQVGVSTSYGRPAYVHGGVANFLFFDGHVEGLTSASIPVTPSRLDNPFWNPNVETIP